MSSPLVPGKLYKTSGTSMSASWSPILILDVTPTVAIGASICVFLTRTGNVTSVFLWHHHWEELDVG